MIPITSFVHEGAMTRSVMRVGASGDLVRELDAFDIRRPLVLAGRRGGAGAGFASLRRALGDRPAVVCDDVPSHSSVELVESLAAQARLGNVDGVVAIGGGSVSDTAKAVVLLIAEGGRLGDHASTYTPGRGVHSPALLKPKLPIVAIPTTASGAEATPSLGIRASNGTKLLFRDPRLTCRLILIDPEFNLQTPASVMLATGMNGLAHCLEGLYSNVRSPVSTALALHGIRSFGEALPAVAVRPDSVAARAALLEAAHLSGLVLIDARTCLHHAICHVIGARTGVAHGDVNAVLLPWTITFNAAAAAPALARAGRLFDGDGLVLTDDEAARRLVERLTALQKTLGVPHRLRDIGIDRSALPDVASQTLHERGLHYNPRPVRRAAEVFELLESAW
jgi:alcohol dehydrogenase class IV